MKATGGRNRSPSRRTFDREDAGVEFAWRKDRSGKGSQEATGDGGVAVQNPREQDEKRKEGNCDKQGTVLEGAHVAPDITGCVEIFTEDMGSAVAAVQNSNKRDVVEVDDSMHVRLTGWSVLCVLLTLLFSSIVFLVAGCFGMAGLEEMWARFSLSKEEERGADVDGQEESIIHHLVGKFFTKRVVNIDAVAYTFKPLWKPRGELKILDVGDNILLFEFKDCLDLESVLEFELWSYDKSLVVFQRALDAESTPSLDFT
nr:hypothetical protein CFP56_49785 [Quercus suber]